MVRPFEWQWKGDYYDPDIPIAIDLHDRVWPEIVDRIRAPGAESFWIRRTLMSVGEQVIPALQPCDRLGYAALHSLRHILRNDAKPAHVFEIAALFSRRDGDQDFWNEWMSLHDEKLRLLESIVFRFASEWFLGGRIVVPLPPALNAWFDEFAYSPLTNICRANKDVLWLHCALLPSIADRIRVARLRLLPLRAPGAIAASDTGWLSRAGYHTRALVSSLRSGARWWRRSRMSSSS